MFIIVNILTLNGCIREEVFLLVFDPLVLDEVSILRVNEAPPSVDRKKTGDVLPSLRDELDGLEGCFEQVSEF